MRFHSLVSIAALACSLTLVGCGDDGGGGEPEPGPRGPVAHEVFSAELASVVCETARACPLVGVESIGAAMIAQIPHQVCADHLAGLGLGTAYDASIASGAIAYDPEAAGRCLDAIAGRCAGVQTTFDPLAGVADCDAAFRGTVSVGSACAIDAECVDGTYCAAISPDACGGLCATAAKQGEVCDDDAGPNCDPSPQADGSRLYCGPTTADPTPRCLVSRQVVVGVGEVCGALVGAEEDTTVAFCEAGLACRQTSGTVRGICVEPIAVGEACSATQDACEQGVCFPSGGGSATTCQLLPLASEVGATCSSSVACNSLLQLECVGGACAAVVESGLGGPCSIENYATCGDGLYCQLDSESGAETCAARIPAGGECEATGDESCESGFCDYNVEPAVCTAPVLVCP